MAISLRRLRAEGVLEEAAHRKAETLGNLGEIDLLGNGATRFLDDFDFNRHA